MIEKKTRIRLYFLVFLSFIWILSQGCGQEKSFSQKEEYGIITGKVPAAEGGKILLRSPDEEKEVPLDPEGKFATLVKPGTYQVLLIGSDGRLSLIKRGVVIEDNITISILDISLVPIPMVISVSVPLIYRDSAIIEWETDIDSDGWVDYGMTAIYGYSTFADSELKRKHRIQLNGLNPATKYHFRIIAQRHSLESVQSFSKDYIFSTEP